VDEARRAAVAQALGAPPALPDDRRPKALVTPDLHVLADVVALVTGAGHGIGRESARALAAAGAAVFVADIDGAAAEEAAAEIRADGGESEAVQTDISDEAGVAALMERVRDRFGRLDVAVNNAAIIHVESLLEVRPETWRRIFRVNVEGTLLVSQAAARLMRQQAPHAALGRRGLLLNVSSMASEFGRPVQAAYASSKAAVNSLSRACAAAFADEEIATVVVYPGNVREGMWRTLGASLAAVEDRTREEVENARSFQPSAEIAETVRDVVATAGMELNGLLVLHTRDIVDI
jgi:NAD(P)-dependent dehydrogenase (short-subunit alcohol dehydrogenase family)